MNSQAQATPVGMTPWDWIAKQNLALMKACANEGIANAIMDLLRGAEVYARDHNSTLEYVEVARVNWTNSGQMLITFRIGQDA